MVELSEHTKMNDHAIKLEEDKQLSFGPIYSLRSIELEILKTYIKTSLANGFIRSFESSIGALILFNQKPDGSLRICVDYWDLNNITIKNQYLLLLIGKLLDWLGRARIFTQLNLTNTYYWMRICEGNEWKTAFWTQYSYLSIKSWLLANLMLRPSSKDTLTKFWLKN